MALHIERGGPSPSGSIIADRRLYLTADRGRVVEESDPAAAFLFAPVGSEISAADVARYGLAPAMEAAAPAAAAPADASPAERPARKRRGG